MPPPTSSLRPKLPGEQTTSGIGAEQFEAPVSAVSSEATVAFGLLILLGIVVLAFRFASRARGSSKVSLPTQHVHIPSVRESSAGSAKPQTKRFDAKTAKHRPGKRVLEGKAWVTDGDTIVINKTQIRLFGIDAPEIDHPFGQKAKWAMVKLCKGHKINAVVTDVDHYGRTVAHCTLPDGRDLSAELVKMGLAIDWPKFSGGKYKHMETPGVRRRLWLADARQAGKMYLWEQFEYDQLHAQKR